MKRKNFKIGEKGKLLQEISSLKTFHQKFSTEDFPQLSSSLFKITTNFGISFKLETVTFQAENSIERNVLHFSEQKLCTFSLN